MQTKAKFKTSLYLKRCSSCSGQ